MFISMQGPVNVIDLLMTLLSWGVIIYFMSYIYRKQEVKPLLWKIALVTIIGLIIFSFDFTVFNTIIKIPILPLGVWVVYFFARGDEAVWEKYRPYAWLGFFANFLFIATALVTILLHNLVFPKSDLTTFISSFETAEINQLHSSAAEVRLDQELLKRLAFDEQIVQSVQWYSEIELNGEPNERKEKFPYQLVGTTSKWGSGIPTMIYIEENGKGILVDTTDKQRYFRTDESFLKGGNHE